MRTRTSGLTSNGTDEDGTRFLVEMQLKRQAGFFDRAVFISSFGIQKQLLRGQKGNDYTLAPVYFIGVLDFILHAADDPRVLYRYKLQEEQTHAVMTDHFQILFLELPKARNLFAEITRRIKAASPARRGRRCALKSIFSNYS